MKAVRNYDHEMEMFRGIWWLPTNPMERRHGTLIIDDGLQGTLRLDGSFSPVREIALRRISEPLILGTSDDGTPISLLEPYHDLVNFLSQNYFARHTLIGAHTTGKEAIANVYFSGTELDNFLGAPAGLQCDPSPLGVRRKTAFRGHEITFSVDRTDEAALADQQPRSVITVGPVVDWETAWDIATTLSLFLTLVSGVENALLDLTITVNGHRARVLTATRTVARERAADRRSTSLMVTLSDIADLDSFLTRFDEVQTSMRHVLGPLVGYLRNPGDITASTTQIAKTLESYHRDRRDGSGVHRYPQTKMKPEAFEDILKSLRTVMAAEFPEHTSMLQILTNAKSLRERVRDLYRAHSAFMDEITDEQSLTRDATDNRNRFAHGSDVNLAREEVETVFWAGERMRLLFYAILFTELGFERSHTYELLRRNDRYEVLALRRS